jgi:hypothetical protein
MLQQCYQHYVRGLPGAWDGGVTVPLSYRTEHRENAAKRRSRENRKRVCLLKRDEEDEGKEARRSKEGGL